MQHYPGHVLKHLNIVNNGEGGRTSPAAFRSTFQNTTTSREINMNDIPNTLFEVDPQLESPSAEQIGTSDMQHAFVQPQQVTFMPSDMDIAKPSAAGSESKREREHNRLAQVTERMEEQTPPPQSQKSSIPVNTQNHQSPRVQAITAVKQPTQEIAAPKHQEVEMDDYEDEIMITSKLTPPPSSSAEKPVKPVAAVDSLKKGVNTEPQKKFSEKI